MAIVRVGHHGHINSYNKGVLVGNWTEERGALQTGGNLHFTGQSTSKSTYGAKLETAGRNERKDVQRKYVCSGKDTILQHEEPGSSSSVPTRGVASITQLSYSKPDKAHKTVQQHLWTGHKATDLHMPACPQRSAAIAAHHQQLQREAAESKWATTSRSAAEIASQGAIGGACKREGCRPAAKGGQPAQIGRKAVGECAQLFDKTWMRIGLRK